MAEKIRDNCSIGGVVVIIEYFLLQGIAFFGHFLAFFE
jgi:hypothetical protein